MKHFEKPFDPKESALRTELVGNLKIDPKSSESRRLLQEWSAWFENLESRGAINKFDFHREAAQAYQDAEQWEATAWVLKGALVEAIEQDNPAEIRYFTDRLREIGEDPNDLDEIYDG